MGYGDRYGSGIADAASTKSFVPVRILCGAFLDANNIVN